MLDPTFTTSLHFLDFGSVYSADGREHPITSMTPAYLTNAAQSSDASQAAQTSQASLASFPGSSLIPHFPPHFGARVAVSVIAIAILLIVVARLLLK